jgi:hypothetical protein
MIYFCPKLLLFPSIFEFPFTFPLLHFSLTVSLISLSLFHILFPDFVSRYFFYAPLSGLTTNEPLYKLRDGYGIFWRGLSLHLCSVLQLCKITRNRCGVSAIAEAESCQ